MSKVSRRKFVATTAAAGAGLTIVPRHVLGRGFQAPSDTLNIATVGIGGMGSSNTRGLMSQNIVAFCDVDDALLQSEIGRGFQAPSDTLNIATVGIGGMGSSNTRGLMSQNIVAFCDVDDALLQS